MINKLMMFVATMAAIVAWADPKFGFWVEMHDVPAESCSCIEHRIGKNHYVMTRLGAIEGGKGTYVAIPVYGLDSELRDEDVFVTAGTYKDAGKPFVWSEEKMWIEYGRHFADAYNSDKMGEDIWDDDDIHWADDCDSEFSPQILDRDYWSGDAMSVLYFMSDSGPVYELVSGIWDDWKPVLGRQWIIVPTPKASSVGKGGKITSFCVTIKVGSQYYSHIVEGVDGTSLRRYKSSNDMVAVGAVAVPFNAGTVSGNGVYKNGSIVALKATASKGYVFAGWSGPIDDSQDPRNPSISYVVGEDDAEFTARFVPVKDDVADISFTMPKECQNGVAIANVSVDVSSCSSLPTVKVSGLPAGLKFTAKPIYKKGSKTEIEVPANTIYGTPTKSGVYTIVATVTTVGKKTATYSQTVIVRKSGEKVVVAECDAAGGKVTGGGVYAAGKKVTLKATPNKGYVFAGWYEDEAFTTPCDSTVGDYRTASYSYTMGNEDKTFYARFIPVSEDSVLDLTVDGENVPTTFTISEYAQLSLYVDSLSLPKISIKGLPAGMKFTAKPIYKKGSKTEIEVPATTIYGAPTKPGLNKVIVLISNQSIKKAVAKEFTIEIPNLTGANSYFVDDLDNGVGKKCVLSVGITNIDDFLPSLKLKSNAVKLAVKGLPSGLKYDAKTGKITGVATKAGTYTVMLTVTDGKAKYVSTITVEVEALPDWVVGTFYGFEIARGDGYYEWVCPMQITVTISAVGKISIKGIEPGEAGTSRSAQLTEVRDDGSYAFSLHHVHGRKGNDGYTEGDLEGVITPMIYGGNVEFGRCIIHDVGVCDEDDDPYESNGEAYQSLYSSKSYVSKIPALVKNTVTIVSLADDYGGYLTLKYGANGAVTTAFSESEGGATTATGSAQLVPYEVDGNITKAWLGTVLKPKGRDPFGVLLFLSIDTSNGNVYGDDVIVENYLLEVEVE